MKSMINMGMVKSNNADKQISLLLQSGYAVYVLKLKKSTQYPVTIHGFDNLIVRQHRSPNSTDISYNVELRRASYATFEPDEDGIAIAFVAGTERNIMVIASHFYSNQFALIEIKTPDGGIIPQIQAQKQIKEVADRIGITPPGYVAPAAPAEKLPSTYEEAVKMAEDKIFEKYDSLVKLLKKENPKTWKKASAYVTVIETEINSMAKELATKAGIAVTQSTPAETEESLVS